MKSATMTKSNGNPAPTVKSARVIPSEGAAHGNEQCGYFVAVTDCYGREGMLIDRAGNAPKAEAEQIARAVIGKYVEIFE